MPPKPKTEAQWMAESDARTLAEAAAIKADAKRRAAAARAASRMVKEEQAKLSGLKSVARSRKGSTGARRE